MATRYFVNKNLRNSLQILSLAIISCTLIIYQVTSAVRAKNELLSDSLSNALIDDINSNVNSSRNSGGNSVGGINKGTVAISRSGNKFNNFNSVDNLVYKRAVADQTGVASNSQSEGVSVDNNLDEVAYPVTYDSYGAKERLVVDNVFLSVKSTKRFHQTRLKPVLKTWFNLAKDQIFIFTDGDDPELERETSGLHLINTHCPATHYRQALCCKMSMEFDAFLRTSKSWFCHFDDDNYVNVPALLELLSKYDHREDWYLGKPSLKGPIHIPDSNNTQKDISFWFATGGAGFCISRALALRMSPLASGGKFIKVCDAIQLPDDVTIGYIVGQLNQNLTVIPQFHSHFETMKFIDMKNPHSEITFSYVRYDTYENILDVKGFTEEEDPTRFLSLHCLLYPNFSYCVNR